MRERGRGEGERKERGWMKIEKEWLESKRGRSGERERRREREREREDGEK